MANYNMEKLSRLTNLKIDLETRESFQQSVNNILEWCAGLNSVDTTNVEPMFSPMDIMNKHLENFREDEVGDGSIQREILSNCPDAQDVFICVPKVIE